MSALVLYEAACTALAECKSVDEVKDWIDRAAAMQAYQRMAKDKRLEVNAAEIRIRAERRLGEMLLEQKANGGLNTGAKGIGTSAVPTENRTPTLAEVGIDKKLSARSQKTAAIPKPEFEEIVGEWRERVSQEGERVTAKLDEAGTEWQEKLARKSPPPEPTPEQEAELDDASQRMADLAADYEVLLRETAADVPLAEANLIIKEMRAKYEQLEKLYNAQRLELAEMTRAAKRWQRKAEGKAA